MISFIIYVLRIIINPATARMPVMIRSVVYVSISVYFVSLMPAANRATDKIVPETNVDRLTLPENPGMKKPMTEAPNNTLPKSKINLDKASFLPEDIMVLF